MSQCIIRNLAKNDNCLLTEGSHCVSVQSRRTSRSLLASARQRCCKKSTCAPRRICVPSKPALVIFAWTFMVGAVFSGMIAFMTKSMTKVPHMFNIDNSRFVSVLVINSILAILALFYPIAGFLADVCCGRYRVIVISVGLLWLSTVFTTISTGFGYAHLYDVSDVFAGITGFIMILGVSGYRPNIIQFGFDQLLEVPSCYLGMFVHWYLWSDSFGYLLVNVLSVLYYCSHHVSTTIWKILHAAPIISFPIFTLTL